MEFLTLFASAFVAATLFPGGSEAVLIYWVHEQPEQKELFWLVATVGNVLGGMTSWGMGYWLAHRWPVESRLSFSRQRALSHVRQWGAPVLIFSWVPVIGDPMCVAAGWLRVPWWQAALWMLVGKGVRYALVIQAAMLVV